jgi:hypothetical protein
LAGDFPFRLELQGPAGAILAFVKRHNAMNLDRCALLFAAALAAAASSGGCGARELPFCSGGSCPSQRSVETNLQTTVNRQLDVLFVVDDTSAIAPTEADLLAAYPSLGHGYLNLPGGSASLHVGFIPASTCAAPAARGATCSVTAPEQFLRAEDCGQTTNFTGTFESDFTCLADLGTAGCAPAQPLAAIRSFFAAPPAGWEGFLRPDAYLEIVIVAAADDGGTEPAATTADAVRALKPDDPAAKILVAVVAPPTCGAAESAPAASRLVDFVSSFGGNGIYTALCAGSLVNTLSVFRTIQVEVAPVCLSGVRDVDPATPGLQPDCVVEDTITRDGAAATSVLPDCDVASPPCWRLAAGTGCAAGALTFTVDRGTDFCSEWSTATHVECLGCVDPADPACAP